MISICKNIAIITNSKKGGDRSQNQDDILILNFEKGFLFVLFDGVSSLSHSIDFIQLCKQFISENYQSYLVNKIRLSDLIFKANEFAMGKRKHPGQSTCSALYISQEDFSGCFLNIGDTRIYIYSNQFLEQITVDDSLPGNKNILTKCLGINDISKEDFVQKQIESSGFLLCTDGFHSLMEEQKKKYFSIFQYKKSKNIVNAIEQLQNKQNKDDSTYILIRRNGI